MATADVIKIVIVIDNACGASPATPFAGTEWPENVSLGKRQLFFFLCFSCCWGCCGSGSANPTKDTREITDHHVLRMFRKCRMLNLRFLRDSYVTWERRRLQTTKFQAFGGLLGTFGGHFGSIFGTFLAHFGGPERTWKHIAYKRGGSYFGASILGPKNCQNWGFVVPKKFQNRGQMYQKR